MKLVDINFSPDAAELKTFGKTMIIGFSIIALIILFVFDSPVSAIGLSLFGLTSFILSKIGKAAMIVYVPWMGIAFVMGTIVSNLILALLFFVIITPIGLIFKLLGRDPMNRTLDKNCSSYWQDATNRDNDGINEYERQF